MFLIWDIKGEMITLHIQDLDDGSILLTAPVMIPGMPDCDFNRGEPPLTVEQVGDFADSYERYQFVDSEHELTRTGKHRGRKRESYILKSDESFELYDGSTKIYPKGTWLMTSHITDKEAIANAKNGRYSGYSPSVRSRETADKILELINQEDYEGAEALKSQSLSGLIKDIPNPVVLSVSLVRKPCQINSKICKIKNNGEIMSDESNIKSKILDAIGMSDAANVEALKSQVVSLQDELEQLKSEHAEALKSMKEEIILEFHEAFKEFSDKSEKPPEEEEEEEEKPEDKNKSSDEDNSEDEEEEKEEEEKPIEADKGSKQGKTHNGSDKSEIIEDTYLFMGRHPDGTSKR